MKIYPREVGQRNGLSWSIGQRLEVDLIQRCSLFPEISGWTEPTSVFVLKIFLQHPESLPFLFNQIRHVSSNSPSEKCEHSQLQETGIQRKRVVSFFVAELSDWLKKTQATRSNQSEQRCCFLTNQSKRVIFSKPMIEGRNLKPGYSG